MNKLNVGGSAPSVQAAKSWNGGVVCKERFRKVSGKTLSTSTSALKTYLRDVKGMAAFVPQAA